MALGAIGPAPAGRPVTGATAAIGTGTAEVAALVRDASASGTRLRITGAGTWLDAGAPPAEHGATARLELASHSGIVEYEPDDLTLTARAGTPLSHIAHAAAAHGQWLPLEPFGAPHGTLGATVATGSYGPLAAAYGTPRNQVLGCELVTGAGTVVRAGGRVVKNVAGFDITRLMIGAWGTLGAITEVTVRLRARPEVDATLAIALAGTGSVERARRWLRVTELAPLAAELCSPALASRLGLPMVGAPVLLLRLGGNAALARAAVHAAASLGDGVPVDADVWGQLRGVESAGDAVLRLSDAPARVALLWEGTARAMRDAGALAHANLVRGVVRIVVPSALTARLPALLAALPACTCIAERGPAALWDRAARSHDARDTRDALALGVRRVFDPQRLFNPGIMDTA